MAWLIALLLALCSFASSAHAAQERYDYDALGRLIRVIDEAGRVTEYVYDPAGNILQVITASSGAQGLSGTATTPNALRRGETKAIIIAGNYFIGAQGNTTDHGLEFGG